jgi:2,3-bisphosphoglycerate-dependent phosphoglycerate mutase
MEFYIIRHAQSANNELYARTGATDGRHPDPALTGIGHIQANHLARFLAGKEDGELGYNAHLHNRDGFSLTHLYTSLMIRSIETATYIAGATRLPLYAWPDIHERGGLYTVDEHGQEVGVAGPNRQELESVYPHLILPNSIDQQGWWRNRPRETVEEALIRARLVWEQLTERHGNSDDRVAIVTHGGFFQSLVSTLFTSAALVEELGMGELWYGISNASVSRIDLIAEGIAIRYLNRIDFLPGNLITG